MIKSKCKQTIAWCYEHGKSFEFLGHIYNINKLGADINLEACSCVGEEEIVGVENINVYYFNPVTDLSNMEEGKKYIVMFNSDSFKPAILKVLEKTPKAIYFTNGMSNDLDGLDISVFADGKHNILTFSKYEGEENE